MVSTKMYRIKNNNVKPQTLNPAPDYTKIAEYYGQNQFGSDSYNNNYGIGMRVPNPFYNEVTPIPLSVTYTDAVGNTKTTSQLLPGDTTTVCAQAGTVSSAPGIVVTDLGSCIEVLPPDTKAPVRVIPDLQPPPPTIQVRGGESRGGGGSKQET